VSVAAVHEHGARHRAPLADVAPKHNACIVQGTRNPADRRGYARSGGASNPENLIGEVIFPRRAMPREYEHRALRRANRGPPRNELQEFRGVPCVDVRDLLFRLSTPRIKYEA